MADFSSLKQTIQSYIKQNGNEEITGNILQDVLLAMVTTMGDGAINSLVSALQDEITARQNQDGTLQGNITAEATARQNQDGILQGNITAEATARQQADTALGGRIDGLQTAINGINMKLAEGYIYAGIATPSTNPGTISGKVFYIAVQAGTYTNLGGTVVTEGITILKYNGTSWVKEQALFTDGGVFDISAYHATGGTLAKYVDLAEALNGGANIPQSLQKGGMSVKFVQSSDNSYVQYRLKSDNFTTTVAYWQKELEIRDISGADFVLSDENNNYIAAFFDGDFKTKNFNTKVTPQTTDIVDLHHADLSISDKDGNILMSLYDGNIKTKNFDSSYYDILFNKFKGKSIGIIGDSISTYNGWLPSDISGYDGAIYATYYPHGNVDSVNKTWWYQMAEMLGISPSKISNCAWSGSRLTTTQGNIPSDSIISAQPGCSTRRVQDLSARGFVPDIIICFISCNDWGNNINIGTWKPEDGIPTEGLINTLREAYAVLLNKIHVNYPLSKVFVCTNLDDYRRDSTSGWPSNNGNGVSTYEWNKNICEIADAFGCEIIDMNKCGINYSNIADYYAVDTGLHPNKDGMELMARKAALELLIKY